MNATFLDLDKMKAKKLADLFSTIDAFFLGDSMSDAPISHMQSSHLINPRIPSQRHESDYAIAVPKKFEAQWKANSPAINIFLNNNERPRLRILLINDDDTDSITESWLRENLGCWSKHHNLNNTEITVIKSRDLKTKMRKLSNGYFHSVFFNNGSKSIDRKVQSTLFQIPSVVPIFMTSGQEPELDSSLRTRIKVISSTSIIAEGQLINLIEPIAERNGLLETEANVEQISGELADLAIFTEEPHRIYESHESPLYRLDNVLDSYSMQTLSSRLSDYINGLVKRAVHSYQPSYSIKDLQELKISDFVPENLSRAISDLRESLIKNFNELIEGVQIFNDPIISFKNSLKNINLLAQIKDELNVCLQARISDLKAFMSIYWGGCGYYKPRALALKEKLIPTIEQALEQEHLEVNGLDGERRELANKFNNLLDETHKLRNQIRDQLYALKDRLAI